MRPKTVKRIVNIWNVENVTDQDFLIVEADDDRTLSHSCCKGIISHPNTKIGDPVVGNESRLFRKHVISDTSIRKARQCRQMSGRLACLMEKAKGFQGWRGG